MTGADDPRETAAPRERLRTAVRRGMSGTGGPRGDERDLASAVVRAGAVAWSVIGIVGLSTIVVLALAAVSELVFPLVFAAMLGIAFHPLAVRLGRHLSSGAAAAVVVGSLALLAVVVTVVVSVAVVGQLSQLGDVNDAALEELGGALDDAGLGTDAPDEVRMRASELAGVLGAGLLTTLVGGIDATIGFITGSVLALFLLYYVLKDGSAIRDWAVAQLPAHLRDEGADFVAAATRSTRAYWAGRTVLSAVVAAVVAGAALAVGLPMVAMLAVVTFLGGYVPYIGAFVGGGLATMLALSHGGLAPAAFMLVVVVVSNVVLENVLEPRVMSDRLAIHPMLVLVATTAGGVLGGLVGLVLAVPLTAIGIDLGQRVRRRWTEGSP